MFSVEDSAKTTDQTPEYILPSCIGGWGSVPQVNLDTKGWSTSEGMRNFPMPVTRISRKEKVQRLDLMYTYLSHYHSDHYLRLIDLPIKSRPQC